MSNNDGIIRSKDVLDKEELESVIRVNQAYDFKSEDSIYKGDKYKFYPRIKDNLPLDYMDCIQHESSKTNYEKESYGEDLSVSSISSIMATNVNTAIGGIILGIIGSASSYIDVLNLAKNGVDLSSLDSVTVNADKN